MTRSMFPPLVAIVAVSFAVGFMVRLVSRPTDERPRTTVVRVPAEGQPARLVADRGRLRAVADLPALRVPPAKPPPRRQVVAAEPAAVAPSQAAPTPVSPAPAPAPVAPVQAPVAPVQAPPPPQPSAEPPERGPVFDSEG